MYDTSASPPPLGSPLEAIFLLVQKTREQRQFMLDRAAFLNFLGEKDGAVEQFNRYVHSLFFHKDETKKKEELRNTQEKVLEAWTKVMKLGVQPLQMVRSRML